MNVETRRTVEGSSRVAGDLEFVDHWLEACDHEDKRESLQGTEDETVVTGMTAQIGDVGRLRDEMRER